MLDLLLLERTVLIFVSAATLILLGLAVRYREPWVGVIVVPLVWITFYYIVLVFDLEPYASDVHWRTSVIRPALILLFLALPVALAFLLRERSRA